ncbi:arginase [uncultured Desulfobacter sp.]|uniref:arginase n=1 Tax=uncultured Desulfobacter sp. TaxID=240139 RepID=UPI002AAAF527|nr:arginase [uncultured Desulfobacter sp.]
MAKSISIIGVPMDFGQMLRGVDMGPAALRYTGLIPRLRKLGHDVIDEGNIPIPVRDDDPAVAVRTDRYVKEITQITHDIYEAGCRVIAQNRMPIFLGGDHAISIGTVASVASSAPAGLIWVDAHADFNTPQTSPSGNVHGMPLAVLTGDGFPCLVDAGHPGAKISVDNVVMIGQRDLDPGEKKRIKASGITIFTMRDIDEQGISAIASKIMVQFARLKRFHLSLDMDALDPVEAPGVGTPVPGGISYREAHLLMELLADSGKMCSMDLVEINPILDVANKTSKLAVELILSALGKSIL